DVGKQELATQILAQAGKVVVDSRSQCSQFSDAARALRDGVLAKEKLIELGEVIADPKHGRTSEEEITVACLTGVAIQDLAIAKSIYEAINE
ncbi:MAG TPA: ornithine cyclodeaminase family protein, partial [Myxococcota bacterium]|nr:ornithine cyclodeaminase family protein [Myxococcota bacterium]